MAEGFDAKALEIFEDLYYFLENKIKLLPLDNPQRQRLEDIQQMAASERRLIEEVSTPCRFILEHLSEQQAREVTLGVETDNFKTKAPVRVLPEYESRGCDYARTRQYNRALRSQVPGV